MAQSPDNKPASSNADVTSQPDSERKIQSAASNTRESERAVANAAQATARQGGEATHQVTRQLGETVRSGAAASADITQAGTRLGAETVQRSAHTLAEGQRQLLEEAAERYETLGHRVAQAMQENAAGWRALLVPTPAATESLRDLREGVAGLINGVIESNVRATQRLFSLADPAAIFDVQSRFMREYLDNLLQGTTTLIRAARESAEQTLRPLEARVEHRRHEQLRLGMRQQNNEDHGVVSDVMSADVRLVNPEDTVQQATRLMREEDTGVLPVGEGDRLVGIVTDRDVALRLVAEGKDPARTKVREVMSQEPKYVFEDEDLGHVADNMAEQQVRRLPVVNRNKRLVGVVSLGDLTRAGRSGHLAGRAMRGVARASGSQVASNAAE